MKRLILILALAGALPFSGCASAPIVNVTNAEHIAVTAVHGLVTAEANAFKAGAYDNAHHQTYVAALLKVTQSEKALNDALMVWNAASGQPMPAIVALAIQNVSVIAADLGPLIPQNSAIASVVNAATAAIRALAGAK